MRLLDKIRERRSPEKQDWRDPDESHPNVEKWFKTRDAYCYVERKEVLRGTTVDTAHILGDSDLDYATKTVYQPHIKFRGPKGGNTSLTIDLADFDTLEEALQGTEAWYQKSAKRSIFSSLTPKTAITKFLEETDAIDADTENDEETKEKSILATIGLLPAKSLTLVPKRWQKAVEVKTPDEAWVFRDTEDTAEVWRYVDDDFYVEVRSNKWDEPDRWSICARPLKKDRDDPLVENIFRGFSSEVEAIEFADQFTEAYARYREAGQRPREARATASAFLGYLRNNLMLEEAMPNFRDLEKEMETESSFG